VKSSRHWATATVIPTFICLFFPSCSSAPSDRSVSRTTDAPIKSEANEWYRSGTLHEAFLKSWMESSQADQLATAADFATAVTGETRERAFDMGELVKRVDELHLIASDFLASSGRAAKDPGNDRSQLRERAEAIRVCISTSATSPSDSTLKWDDVLRKQQVAEIAAICAIRLGYQPPLPEAGFPLDAERLTNTKDDYARLIALHGMPNSLLSTEKDTPKPSIPIRRARYYPAKIDVVLIPLGCEKRYDAATRLIKNNEFLTDNKKKSLTCIPSKQNAWTIVGYIDEATETPTSATEASSRLSGFEKLTRRPIME